MRVNEKSYAKRIKATLRDWDVVCDKEEAIDCVFHYFSRLHGIGVAVNVTGDRNHYEFMKFPYESTEDMEDFKFTRKSTCLSAKITICTEQISDASKDSITHIFRFVEDKLYLPHWENYLGEYVRPYYNTDWRGDSTAKIVRPSCGNRAKTRFTDEWIVDDLVDDFKKNFDPKFLATTISKDEVTPKTILNSIFGMKKMYPMNIEKVIFNDPATIVIWKDGSKTVVKAQDGETYDPEKGLAMAICKKAMGNTRDYYITFKKYLKQWKKENPEKKDGEILIHSNAALMAFAAIRHLNVERGVKSVDGTCNFTFSNKCDEEITVAEVPEFISQTAYDNICNIVCQRFNL